MQYNTKYKGWRCWLPGITIRAKQAKEPVLLYVLNNSELYLILEKAKDCNYNSKNINT